MENSNIKHIDEAVYSVLGNDIVARRKNPLISIAVTALGAVMIFVVGKMPHIQGNADMHSAVVFFGGMAAICGGIVAIVRLFGKKNTPYYKPTHERMRCVKEYFDGKYIPQIKDSLQNCNLEQISSVPRCDSSPVMMVSYATPSNRVVVAQLQQFIPYSYVPASETVVVKN